MAAFAETRTYLQFEARPYGKKDSLLWPVLIYRVLYPDTNKSKLNLFQRAVLGLIRAKVVRSDAIADLTGLHTSLITLILAQGVSEGWLVENADALTKNGAKLLDNEEAENADLKVGYLLQDAVTGQFWPRMVTRLHQLDPIDPMAKHPEFLPSRKTGRPLRPYVILSRKAELPLLDHVSLLNAYRDYRDDYRANLQLGHSGELHKQVRLNGVQQLDEAPQSARVLVWVTADQDGADLWAVKDPFGLRENAWWLQATLYDEIERDSNLVGRLEGLIEVPRAEGQTVVQWQESIRKQTELQVLTEFPWVERQPDIKRYLAGLLVCREKLKQDNNNEHELAAALMESQKLLEVVMQWLIRKYPANAGQLPKSIRSDPKINREILSALQIPSFTEDVIRGLATQKLDQVILACSKPTNSLKALLFAAALGGYGSPLHPLKVLGHRELQLIKLLELAGLRNDQAHAQSVFTGRTKAKISSSTVLDNIQYAINFTSHFKDWM